MCATRTVLVVLVCLTVGVTSVADDGEDPEEKLVKKVIKECTESKARLRCFANKAAVALERSVDMDIPLFDGIRLVRNEEKAAEQPEKGRALGDGFARLKTAVWNFINTHRLSLDLTQGDNGENRQKKAARDDDDDGGLGHHYLYYEISDESDEDDDHKGGHDDHHDDHHHEDHHHDHHEYHVIHEYQQQNNKRKPGQKGFGSGGGKGGGGGGGTMKGGGGGGILSGGLFKGGLFKGGQGGGGGGGGDQDRKRLRRERKYMQYAFMVLLGIFGLTGPLVMKTLAVIAAKALISSKMALIIVGSVMLKKLFEKEHHHPSVKVHTINADHEDEHDRLYRYNQILPYSAYSDYAKPT